MFKPLRRSFVALSFAAITLSGCGESHPTPTSGQEAQLKSIGELRKAKSDATNSAGADQRLAAEDAAARKMLRGLDSPPASMSGDGVAEFSESDDRNSAIEARFRVPLSKLDQVLAILSKDQPPTTQDEWMLLEEIDDEVFDSIFWEMNQLSSAVDFDEARARLIPARRAWVMTNEAEDSIAWDGVNGYFGNRGPEALVLEASCRFLGLDEHARAFSKAIASMPTRSDGSVDWYKYPLGDSVAANVDSDFDLLMGGGAFPRLKFALRHPELFFTRSADAYVPPQRKR